MEKPNVAQPGQYLSFFLKGQGYGLPISSVREINRMSEITPVPETPSFVAGVMNLRGKVIPIVNLSLKLGMEAQAATKDTCIIVVDTDMGQVGMIVDAVSAVIHLTADQIEPSPAMGQKVMSSAWGSSIVRSSSCLGSSNA